MKKYKVTVSHTVNVSVEADNQREAKSRALDLYTDMYQEGQELDGNFKIVDIVDKGKVVGY